MEPESHAQERDLALAYLLLLHIVTKGGHPLSGRLLEQLRVMREDDLRRIGKAVRGGNTGIPPRLISGGASGLMAVLDAATDPDLIAGDCSAAAIKVERILGDRLVADLLELSDDLQPGSGIAKQSPEFTVVPLMMADGGWAASTLWTDSQPAARHPLFRPAAELAPEPAAVAAAIRRTLAPFESMSVGEIEVGLDGGFLWPAGAAIRQPLGLLAALRALGRITALLGPSVRLVAIGECDGEGVFKSLNATSIAATSDALAHLECDILAPTDQGWVLTRPDGTTQTVKQEQCELDGAAQLVWGEAWEQWKRERHRVELIQLGWMPVDWETKQPNQSVPETDIGQVVSLYLMFREGHSRVAVLGGTRGSGKSVIVRRLAAKLTTQRRPPLVRVIASTTHELPKRQLAIRVGRHALGMDQAAPGQRRLIVLEELYPVGDGNVDELLPYLARNLDASVLAVLQYDMNSTEEWQTNSVNVVTAVVGRRAMREFVERLSEEHPKLVDRQKGLAELEKLHPPRDLHGLLRAMLTMRGPIAEEAGQDAGGDPLVQLLRAMDGSDRRTLAVIAAWSLARWGVEADSVAALDPDWLAAFGVETDFSGRRVRISSPDDCRTVLNCYHELQPNNGDPKRSATGRPLYPLDAAMVELMLPGLVDLLRDGSDQVITCLRGVRLHRSVLCAELVGLAWRDGSLQQWIQQTHSARLAELLTSLNVWLGDEVVSSIVRRLADRLPDRSERFSVPELLIVLRCLRSYLPEISPRWSAISDWIHDQVADALTAGDGSPDELLQLLRRTESFHDLDLKQLVVQRVIEVVPGLTPSRADDYYLVRRVRSLQSRAERALRWDQVSFPIEHEPAVVRLLEEEPAKNAGFHVVLGWLILRRYMWRDDWEQLLDEFEYRFPSALRYTSISEFIRAIDELRAFGPFYANAVFMRASRRDPRSRARQRQPFLDGVRKLVRDGSPTEVANLIRSVSAVHMRVAHSLVHVDTDTPDDELATLLAERVMSFADTKGAGMLLSAAHAVDDVYIVRSQGFAQMFGERLGQQDALRLLRDDPRPSVKYYLLKGLWDAQVPFRRACLDAVLDVVADAIAGSHKPWGPRLALQVGADPEMGQDFLVRLRARISLRAVLDGMGPFASPEGQAEFHRLGRALYPAAAAQYAREFDLAAFLRPLAAAPLLAAAECCREVARTLSDADQHRGGREIVAAADHSMGETHAWANRLARTRNGEQLTQALNILGDIDPAQVRSMLGILATRVVQTHDEEESLVVVKTRQAMFDSATAGAGLLSALEGIGGLGRTLYDHLRQDEVLLRVFNFDLQAIQAPSVTYAAARHLATIGIVADHPDAHWMAQVFKVQLQFIRLLGSPTALRDILRTLAIWNPRWGDQGARMIDHGRLSARIRAGLARDLGPAVDLGGVLHSLDDHAGCSALVDVLGQFEPGRVIRHVGLRRACVLLELALAYQPLQSGELATAINAAVDEQLLDSGVLDERAKWMEIGHVCYILRAGGFAVTASVAPPVAPNIAHPAAIVWALHYLPDIDWRRRPLAAAIERFLTDPQGKGGSLFEILAVASLLGRTEQVVGALGNIENAAELLTFRQLRVLHGIAELDPALSRIISAWEGEVERRLAGPLARASWDARRLADSRIRPPGEDRRPRTR